MANQTTNIQQYINLPSPPTTSEIVIGIMQLIAAQSGILTDTNSGSQVRAWGTSVGAVIEQQGIMNQVAMLQYAVQGALGIFGITQTQATYATGNVTFTIGAAQPTNVYIPAGTLVSTSGGIVFFTTSASYITAGQLSVTIGVQAQNAGTAGNVAAGSIIQVISALPYAITVSNGAATSGGADLEPITETLTRFNAVSQALAACTPVALAAGVLNYTLSGTGETVKYSTCYEPWLAQAASGVTSGFTVGYDIYVDNGSGTASNDLLSGVTNLINGTPGLGPAGVPFAVYAVNAVPVSGVVNAVAAPFFVTQTAAITTAIQTSVDAYFAALQFGQDVSQGALLAQVADATYGQVSSIEVNLTPSGAYIPIGLTQRAQLIGLTINTTT